MTIHLPHLPPTNNPFEIARRDLLAAIACMPVPGSIDPFPHSEEFQAVGAHIRYATVLFDTWLRKIGIEIKANSTAKIDMRQFDRVYSAAVEGWTDQECERAAEQVLDDAEELVR
jgi:hypothetical protein